ncbi:ABC transporter permease, partial [Thiolapillus sp.]
MTPHYWQLILYKTRADLKMEAARGYMGMLWWVLEPVLYMGAFYIIFAVALQRGGENFVPWLLTGLVVWKWFDTTVRMSLNVITAGKGLMSQVYLPKVFFPAVVILKNSVKFLVTLVLLLLFLLVYGMPLGWSWLMVPVLLLVQLLLICGVTFS